jgi:transposase, IS5 family
VIKSSYLVGMRMRRYKKVRVNRNIDLFEKQDQVIKLEMQKGGLEKLNKLVDWDFFEKEILKLLPEVDYSKGGRPPISRALLFKVMVLQQMYNLSDDEVEYQIIDRTSFKNFLGIESYKDTPDAKTIWLVRDQLNKAGIFDRLFIMFVERLKGRGIVLEQGAIIDATIVDTPIQRNTREENKEIKEGNGDTLWKDEPNKKEQKDIDGRWTQKHGEDLYGYKDHVLVDAESKIIIDFEVTNAAIHDSQLLPELIEGHTQIEELYGDSAYRSEAIDNLLAEKSITNKIHEKGKRNQPLTKRQFTANRKKSRIRARVEHVFGIISRSMGGIKFYVRSLERMTAKITMMNLVYNIKRAVYLSKDYGGAMPI